MSTSFLSYLRHKNRQIRFHPNQHLKHVTANFQYVYSIGVSSTNVNSYIPRVYRTSDCVIILKTTLASKAFKF